jgi:Arc/MetJ family transcription regulator
MGKTSVEIDRDIAKEAASLLGTTTLRDTIDRALREVIDATRRLDLVDLLADPARFDFDLSPAAWGGDSLE